MNDTPVTPDAGRDAASHPTAHLGHAEAARYHLQSAHRQGARAGAAMEAGQNAKAGIYANRQRLQLKYAEVNAALALVDELSRIGLAR